MGVDDGFPEGVSNRISVEVSDGTESVGDDVGALEGRPVGFLLVGNSDGLTVGFCDGTSVGLSDGIPELKIVDGVPMGLIIDGLLVGLSKGNSVGSSEGLVAVGDADGALTRAEDETSSVRRLGVGVKISGCVKLGADVGSAVGTDVASGLSLIAVGAEVGPGVLGAKKGFVGMSVGLDVRGEINVGNTGCIGVRNSGLFDTSSAGDPVVLRAVGSSVTTGAPVGCSEIEGMNDDVGAEDILGIDDTVG